MKSASRRARPIQAAGPEAGFDVIPFPIYVVDTATHELVSVNQAMRRGTDAAPGAPCHTAIYGQDRPCTFCRIPELSAEGSPRSAVFEHFNDRDEHWYQLHETLVDWFDGRRVKHSIAVDIDALKEAQNELSEAYAMLALKSVELEKASVTDALTGLFNRRRLEEIFARELDRIRRYDLKFSVIMADVDHFKSVNDTLGHGIGDEVLVAVSNLLRRGVRAVDTVGRWGGEEFLILCPDTELDGAVALADKLRTALAETPLPGVGRGTASFGVAELTADEGFRELVGRADTALYRAKVNGRNRVEG